MPPARRLWDKGIAEYVSAARRLRGAGKPVAFLLAGTPDPGNPGTVSAADVRGWVDAGVLQWLGHADDMAALFATKKRGQVHFFRAHTHLQAEKSVPDPVFR